MSARGVKSGAASLRIDQFTRETPDTIWPHSAWKLFDMNEMSKHLCRAASVCGPIAVLVFSASAQEPVFGEYDWICRNPTLEISCPQRECEVAEAHTSMSVTASSEDLEVCAYTGCWSGAPAATVRSGPFQTYSGVRLLYLMDTDDGAYASLTIDTRSGVGTLLVTGYYAQPMICEQRDTG